ncbi:MAG: hypothetical protein ACYDDF_05625 [Thermoplasmatota archaeon]
MRNAQARRAGAEEAEQDRRRRISPGRAANVEQIEPLVLKNP